MLPYIRVTPMHHNPIGRKKYHTKCSWGRASQATAGWLCARANVCRYTSTNTFFLIKTINKTPTRVDPLLAVHHRHSLLTYLCILNTVLVKSSQTPQSKLIKVTQCTNSNDKIKQWKGKLRKSLLLPDWLASTFKIVFNPWKHVSTRLFIGKILHFEFASTRLLIHVFYCLHTKIA